MKMKMKIKNMINLYIVLDKKYNIKTNFNKRIINNIIDDDVVEFDVENIDELNDVEFLKLIHLIGIIKNNFQGSLLNLEFIEIEMNKRFNNNMNDLIYKFLDEFEIEYENYYENYKNVEFKDHIKNLYLIDVLYFYEFIKYNDEFKDNKYYECFYDELIDYIYIYVKYDPYNEFYDIYENIDELFEINENISRYINYDEIIDDLEIDDYFYNIEIDNKNYYIHNSYF